MNSQDLPLTINETRQELKENKFSLRELVDAYSEQIETFNPQLNAYITLTLESAKKKASVFDNKIKEVGNSLFEKYPLLGVTVSHKDIFLTKGVRSTAASKVLSEFIPQYSSTVVNRLENAGCITLGKVNCDAWAHGSSGENSDFGPTKNPWNKDYVPGGSSSGSGASVGANMTLIATASDTCGSTRLPANFCYGVGLKPTYGAVSRYGIVAMASSLDCPGHITRSVSDSELVFDSIRGEDGHDSTVKTVKKSSPKEGKIKIGIPKQFFESEVDSEVSEKIDEAINIFKSDGVQLKEVNLPHTKYAISVYYIIQPAEVSSNLGRYDGVRFGKNRSAFGDEAKRRIMLGTYVLSSGYWDAYYLKAMKVRSVIIKELDDVLKDVDVLIAPVAPSPPFKLNEKTHDPLKMYLTDIFAATANLSGIPAITLPFGFTKTGLPLGFQLMGPRFSEELLFSLGKRFEKLTDYQPKVAKL